ncbi:MAG: O-antigen ligase family protein [Pseudomonadota bacterium]|nr:O-antigen ligase family protein [Pseudomonadota bacterium]
MVSAQPATSARLLLAGFGIVGVGFLVALATDVAVTLLSPAKLAFVLGGFALLIPTMVAEDAKAYWLFLLVASIPFDISKWMSAWLVDPETLVDMYGMPASGTVTLELYLTDVVLVAMLLPWLARVCLRRERLYFPKIGYLFVVYLAWALLVSLINAESLYLSMFELCREALYFLSFVYLINNVATRLQFRSAVWAVFLGLIIGAGTVITFFEMGIGTDTVAFASLHDQPVTSAQTQTHKTGTKATAPQNLTLHIAGRGLGSTDRGQGSEIKRSQGMFRHPGIPASLCGLTLPIVLAYLIAARKNRDRILFFMVYAWGFIALLLTFSRAGLIGFMVGTVVFFAVGGWSGLISRRVLKLSAVALTLAMALSIPLLLVYLKTRPESFFMRFNMAEAALMGYSQHPILGVGLNNGTAAMKAGRQELRDMGIPMPPAESADSYYLAVLMEVGPVGSILFFVFFGKIVMIALRAMREVAVEMREVAVDMKPLLVGIVAGLASLATQNLADEPLAGHAVSGMLWLFAALIVAIARYIQAETRSSSAGGHAAPVGP